MSDKPILRPVAVPWQVSPSASLIGLHATEGSLEIEALGFFGHHQVEEDTVRLGGDPAAISDEAYNRLGYRVITCRFSSISAFRMCPPQLPSALLDETRYDFSEFPQRFTAEMNVSSWKTAFDAGWRASRICPDPRFYEVSGASWRVDLGIQSDRPRHWMLLGHDAYVEVLAEDFNWTADQPL